MTTVEQRIEAILACPDPRAPAAAARMRRLATPLGPADIIRVLSASTAVCQSLREVVDAVERGAPARAPDALYTSIREAEQDRRLWFDGFYIDENGKLLLRVCVHQYEWSPEYGGHLVPRSWDISVPVDEILHMEKGARAASHRPRRRRRNISAGDTGAGPRFSECKDGIRRDRPRPRDTCLGRRRRGRRSASGTIERRCGPHLRRTRFGARRPPGRAADRHAARRPAANRCPTRRRRACCRDRAPHYHGAPGLARGCRGNSRRRRRWLGGGRRKRRDTRRLNRRAGACGAPGAPRSLSHPLDLIASYRPQEWPNPQALTDDPRRFERGGTACLRRRCQRVFQAVADHP